MMFNQDDFNTVLYQIIGRRIKQLREKKGLTQAKMAESTKINRSSLSNIESGYHQPSLHNLYLIFNVLEEPLHSHLPTFTEITDQISSSQGEIKLVQDLKNKDVDYIDAELLKKIQELIKKMDHGK